MNELKKFWLWMSKKGYCRKHPYIKKYIFNSTTTNLNIPKQMLIGYFIEYILEKTGYLIVTHKRFKSIDEIYEHLYKKVKLLEGRE